MSVVPNERFPSAGGLASRVLLCLAAVAVAAAASPATAAELLLGDLIVVDAVAEGTGAVVRVDPVTGERSLIASGDSLDLPVAAAIEPGGTILVLDLGPEAGPAQVVRVDPRTGAQSVLSSGGQLVAPAVCDKIVVCTDPKPTLDKFGESFLHQVAFLF